MKPVVIGACAMMLLGLYIYHGGYITDRDFVNLLAWK